MAMTRPTKHVSPQLLAQLLPRMIPFNITDDVRGFADREGVPLKYVMGLSDGLRLRGATRGMGEDYRAGYSDERQVLAAIGRRTGERIPLEDQATGTEGGA